MRVTRCTGSRGSALDPRWIRQDSQARLNPRNRFRPPARAPTLSSSLFLSPALSPALWRPFSAEERARFHSSPARTIDAGVLFQRSVLAAGLFEHIIPRVRAKIFAWSNRLVKSCAISQIDGLSFPRDAARRRASATVAASLPPLCRPCFIPLALCRSPLLLLAQNSSHAAETKFSAGQTARMHRRNSVDRLTPLTVRLRSLFSPLVPIRPADGVKCYSSGFDISFKAPAKD